MKMYRLQRCRIRQGLLSSTNSTNTTNNELPCNDIICLILLDIYKYCFLLVDIFYNQKNPFLNFLSLFFYYDHSTIIEIQQIASFQVKILEDIEPFFNLAFVEFCFCIRFITFHRFIFSKDYYTSNYLILSPTELLDQALIEQLFY